MRQEQVLAAANFDDRLPKYLMLQALFGLLIGFVTIPLIPLWALFGWVVHNKQVEELACELTDRSLNIRRGVIFKVQKNIPLDKITDLAVNEGPVLRYLGLCSLKVETAGGGQGSNMGQATLAGVVEALAFRDKVLDQRDRVAGGAATATGTEPPTSPSDALLVEIRDTLHRIEGQLGARE